MSNSCSRVGQVAQADRLAVEAVGERLRRAPACGWRRRVARLLRGEMGRAQLDHFAGADEQHAAVLDSLSKMRCARRTAAAAIETDCAPISVRAAHFLGHREGALEQLVQTACRSAPAFGAGAHGLLHLSEDLRSRPAPSNRAREATRNAWRTASRLRQRVDVRREFGDRELVIFRQPLDRGFARGLVVGGAVELGAVAGRAGSPLPAIPSRSGPSQMSSGRQVQA